MREKKETVTDMKQIIELIKEKHVKEASELLNISTIKNADADMTTRLLFELLPLTGRTAKEMMDRIVRYGKWNLKEKDDQGNFLLEAVIKQKKTGVLAELALKITKKELKREPVRSECTELLNYLLAANQKIVVKSLLDKGILRLVDESEKTFIYQKIVVYKDEDMVTQILKESRRLPVDIFITPVTGAERQFQRKMLNKYARHISLEEDREKLWEYALGSGAQQMIWRMLRKKKDYQYLSRMAQNTDEVFAVLKRLRPRQLLDEVKKEVLLSALQSDRGRRRLDELCKKGWDRAQSSKEKLSIVEDYKDMLNNKRYEKNKKGQLEMRNDRGKLVYLISCEAGD